MVTDIVVKFTDKYPKNSGNHLFVQVKVLSKCSITCISTVVCAVADIFSLVQYKLCQCHMEWIRMLISFLRCAWICWLVQGISLLLDFFCGVQKIFDLCQEFFACTHAFGLYIAKCHMVLLEMPVMCKIPGTGKTFACTKAHFQIQNACNWNFLPVTGKIMPLYRHFYTMYMHYLGSGALDV